MARLNKTRYALLGILSSGPASGYGIKIMMEQSTNHFWKEGDASIYPILKKLLKENLVTLEVVNAESSKPKKVYTITKAGRQTLQEWLIMEPEAAPSRNELLLKVFFGWNMKPDITIKHIQNLHTKVQTILDQYRTSNLAKKAGASNNLTKTELYQFLTLKAGIMHSESVLRWCDEALRLLTKNDCTQKKQKKK